MSNANFITLFWRNFCHKYTHGVMMSNSLKISHKKRYIIQLIFTSASERTLLSVDIRAAIKAEVDIFDVVFSSNYSQQYFQKKLFWNSNLFNSFILQLFFSEQREFHQQQHSTFGMDSDRYQYFSKQKWTKYYKKRHFYKGICK